MQTHKMSMSYNSTAVAQHGLTFETILELTITESKSGIANSPHIAVTL